MNVFVIYTFHVSYKNGSLQAITEHFYKQQSFGMLYFVKNNNNPSRVCCVSGFYFFSWSKELLVLELINVFVIGSLQVITEQSFSLKKLVHTF